MKQAIVNEQSKMFWAATETGWKKVAGFKITANGINFVVVPHFTFGAAPSLKILSAMSGTLVTTIVLDKDEIDLSETKAGFLKVLQELAYVMAKELAGKAEQIKADLLKSKAEMEERFGLMPASEPFDDSDLM